MFKGVVSDLGRPFAARTRGLCSQTSQSAAVISDESDTSPPKLLSAKPAHVAVALTHWPSLARLLRAELLSLRNAPYVAISKGFGKRQGFIVWHHLLPHVLPHCLVGALLLFPHAILHEAALTFLGVGLDPTQPAIGVLLADAMRYLTGGYWWLGVFPGLGLLLMVLAIERFASMLRKAL